MNLFTGLVAAVAFVSWGVGSFISKLSADRLGSKSVFFDLLGYFPAVLIYCLVAFNLRDLSGDKTGMWLGVLAGALGSIGIISFYVLIARSESSLAVPITALYPALTVLLAFVFLHETVTAPKIAGVLLSLS